MNNSEQEQREKIESEAKSLVSTIADLQDCLCLKLEGGNSEKGPEVDAVCYANNALRAFSDSAYKLQAAKPRSVRDIDRAKLLPGQHSGVYLQFEIPNEGTILFVNFKGGLRILSSLDLHDTDPTGLKTSHTKTTDKVLEQAVEINWQLKLMGGPQIAFGSS